MRMTREMPRYEDLPVFEKTGEAHAWGVFRPGDQLGTVNLLTPERVLAAAHLVRKGRVINLNLPLNEPDPYPGGRPRYKHHIYTTRNGRDDSVDDFYLQGSSQWDALRHFRYRE